MTNILRILQILLLAVSSTVLTTALTCDKLIMDTTTIGETGVSNDIMEMGRYMVRMTQRIKSDEVQSLMATLNGASDIETRSKSFTAILQPKDLKKVCITTV